MGDAAQSIIVLGLAGLVGIVVIKAVGGLSGPSGAFQSLAAGATGGCPAGYVPDPSHPGNPIFGGGTCLPVSGAFANDNGQVGFTTGGNW